MYSHSHRSNGSTVVSLTRQADDEDSDSSPSNLGKSLIGERPWQHRYRANVPTYIQARRDTRPPLLHSTCIRIIYHHLGPHNAPKGTHVYVWDMRFSSPRPCQREKTSMWVTRCHSPNHQVDSVFISTWPPPPSTCRQELPELQGTICICICACNRHNG